MIYVEVLLPSEENIQSAVMLFLLFVGIFVFCLRSRIRGDCVRATGRRRVGVRVDRCTGRLRVVVGSRSELGGVRRSCGRRLAAVKTVTGAKKGRRVLSCLGRVRGVTKATLYRRLCARGHGVGGLLGCVLRSSGSMVRGPRVSMRVPGRVKRRLFSVDVVIKGLVSGTVHKATTSSREELSFRVCCKGKVVGVRVRGDVGSAPGIQGKVCLAAGDEGRKRKVKLRGIGLMMRGCRNRVRVYRARGSFRIGVLLCVGLSRG